MTTPTESEYATEEYQGMPGKKTTSQALERLVLTSEYTGMQVAKDQVSGGASSPIYDTVPPFFIVLSNLRQEFVKSRQTKQWNPVWQNNFFLENLIVLKISTALLFKSATDNCKHYWLTTPNVTNEGQSLSITV